MGNWSQCNYTEGHRAFRVREEPQGRGGNKWSKTIVSFLQQAFIKHLLCTTLKTMDRKTVGWSQNRMGTAGDRVST